MNSGGAEPRQTGQKGLPSTSYQQLFLYARGISVSKRICFSSFFIFLLSSVGFANETTAMTTTPSAWTMGIIVSAVILSIVNLLVIRMIISLVSLLSERNLKAITAIQDMVNNVVAPKPGKGGAFLLPRRENAAKEKRGYEFGKPPTKCKGKNG